jgi:hypothetical protein
VLLQFLGRLGKQQGEEPFGRRYWAGADLKVGPSIDKVGPSADTLGPSADTLGPSADTLGPSIDLPVGPSIDLPECLDEDSRGAGLFQADERRQGFLADVARQAPPRQQGHVHGPIPLLMRAALHAQELVVRQPAELILDDAQRLVEQEGRRLGSLGAGRTDSRRARQRHERRNEDAAADRGDDRPQRMNALSVRIA